MMMMMQSTVAAALLAPRVSPINLRPARLLFIEFFVDFVARHLYMRVYVRVRVRALFGRAMREQIYCLMVPFGRPNHMAMNKK